MYINDEDDPLHYSVVNLFHREWPTCESPASLRGVKLTHVRNVSNLVCDLPAFEDPQQQYIFNSTDEVTITCAHHGIPTPTVFITGSNGKIVSEVKKGKRYAILFISLFKIKNCFMLIILIYLLHL